MAIRDKIKEIEDALDTMILTNDGDESFGGLKQAVIERIQETQEATEALLVQEKFDLSEDLRKKMMEIESATSTLLSVDDDKVSKEAGSRIKELIGEIKDATDVLLIDDRTKK